MTEGQVQQIAELEVRRYFDTYLNTTFPRQMDEIISHHNNDNTAHGGVSKKVGRLNTVIYTLIAAGGLGAGVGLKELLPLLLGAG